MGHVSCMHAWGLDIWTRDNNATANTIPSRVATFPGSCGGDGALYNQQTFNRKESHAPNSHRFLIHQGCHVGFPAPSLHPPSSRERTSSTTAPSPLPLPRATQTSTPLPASTFPPPPSPSLFPSRSPSCSIPPNQIPIPRPLPPYLLLPILPSYLALPTPAISASSSGI